MLKGQVTPDSYGWAIDPTVLELNGKAYLLWSGWPKEHNKVQQLYIAALTNPWTTEGDRVLLSKPDQPWEKHTEMPDWSVEVPSKGVNEAPEVLQHNGQTFVVYSASGCWTDFYALGLLQLAPGADPLDPKSWTKLPGPVFQTDPNSPAYGPGHNGFFTSPDGTESWILYHANSAPGQGCGDTRSMRMQRFTWSPDGLPVFGAPVPLGVPLAEPSSAAQGLSGARSLPGSPLGSLPRSRTKSQDSSE
jgi:GH43 family beta-xylosidase